MTEKNIEAECLLITFKFNNILDDDNFYKLCQEIITNMAKNGKVNVLFEWKNNQINYKLVNTNDN